MRSLPGAPCGGGAPALDLLLGDERVAIRQDVGVIAAFFTITPLGTGESVGDLVAEAVRVVRASGLPYETNAMFTNIEGEWDEVMAVIRGSLNRLSESARAFRW